MPKIHKVTYNGTASASLGIFITGSGTFDAAELDVTAYQVPGRNGDVLIPNNRYKNITVTYPAFIPKAFQTNVQGIRNWLRSSNTYAKISDDYDTSHFRMGIAVGLKFSPVNQNDAANFQLVFNCKPQRFLNSGNSFDATTSGAVLANPTGYEAQPVFYFTNIASSSSFIQVVNSLGTFKLQATGSYTGSLYVDCETQNVYYGAANHNDLFEGPFPVLAAGNNTITFSGMTNFSVKKRWWEL